MLQSRSSRPALSNLTFPQAVEAAEAKQAAEVSKAVEAAKAKQAAKVSKAESEKKHQEGPQGFVLKFADPKPAAQAAATAAAQEASSSFEAESSTAAFGRSAPHKAAKGGKAKPDQGARVLAAAGLRAVADRQPMCGATSCCLRAARQQG